MSIKNEDLTISQKLFYTKMSLMINRVRFALNRTEEDVQFKKKCDIIINMLRQGKDVNITSILNYKKKEGETNE